MQLEETLDILEEQEIGKHLEKTVFVIDDDEIILRVVTQHLTKAGFAEKNVHGFTSPTEALEILRFVKPSLVITDIHMPALSGDCMAKLMQWPEFNAAPVIAITGDDSFKLDEMPSQCGISQVVFKPIDGHDFLRNVFAVLELNERQNEVQEREKREKEAQQSSEIRIQEEKLRKSFGKT